MIQKRESFQLVDLGLPSGNLWTDHNVGADMPRHPGHFILYKSGLKIPTGNSYALPTLKDFKELFKHCTGVWEGSFLRLSSKINQATLLLPMPGMYSINQVSLHYPINDGTGYYPVLTDSGKFRLATICSTQSSSDCTNIGYFCTEGEKVEPSILGLYYVQIRLISNKKA